MENGSGRRRNGSRGRVGGAVDGGVDGRGGAGALRGHGSDRRCGGGIHTVRDGSAVEMEASEREAPPKVLMNGRAGGRSFAELDEFDAENDSDVCFVWDGETRELCFGQVGLRGR